LHIFEHLLFDAGSAHSSKLKPMKTPKPIKLGV